MIRPCLAVAFLTLAPGALAGTLYVSSDFSHEVLRYDDQTGAFIDIFIPAASGGLDQPHGILHRGGVGDVLVCSFGTDQVLRYDASTGAFLGVFIDSATGLNDPVYIVPVPGTTDMLISSQASEEILRFASDGTPLGALVSAGGGGGGGLDGPSGFALAPGNRLLVAGRYSANVLAYDATTGAFLETILDATDGLTGGDTFGLQLSPAGDLYVASNGAIHHCDLDTNTVINTVALGFPIGLERTASGDILAASSNNLFHIDHDNADALTGPILSGGAINVLNFFHRVPDCPADLDDDDDVDVFDFGAFTTAFGASGNPPYTNADFDGDGDTDVLDFALFAPNFGCPN